MIHIPKEYTVGRASVSANAYMVKRIIEELVRFPLKRKELLTKRVRQYVTLRAPFRSGDSYIIPESLPQWTELLRMDWLKKKVEFPKHIEEFAWSAEAETEEGLPEELEAMFGSTNFFFLPKFEGLKQGYIELGVPSERVPDGILDRGQINELARILSLSMVQLEYEDDTPLPKQIEITRAKKKGVRNDLDFIVSVKLPDTTVGFMSSRPDRIVAIPGKDLPSSISDLIRKNGNLVAV
jgi:hypothetical protein